MADIKIRRSEGLARTEARKVVARRNLQREAELAHQRSELLEGMVQKQLSRMNRTMAFAVLWLGLLILAFIALGWYGSDIFAWALAHFGPAPK